MRILIAAEAGVNHLGDRSKMLALCDAAKAAGADAVKFQAYDTDKLLKRRGSGDAELLRRCQMSDDDFKAIAAHCSKLGIFWFASVFDIEQVYRLRRMNMPMVKIAHKESDWSELIEAAASQFGNVYVSLNLFDDMHGMDFVDAKEEQERMRRLYDLTSIDGVRVVHTVAQYPATSSPCLGACHPHGMTGFSSHYTDWRIPAAAALRGIEYLEAHIKLSDGDPEAKWSLGVEDFTKMVKQAREYDDWL